MPDIWGVPLLDDTLFGLIARAMMYVVCACQFVFCSSSLDIVGGEASMTTHDDTTTRYSSGSIRYFYLHPNIRDESCNTKSEVQYF